MQQRLCDSDPASAAIIAKLRANEAEVKATIAQGRALLARLKGLAS